MAENFGRWVKKFDPLSLIPFYQNKKKFWNHTSTEICENSRFSLPIYGKNKRSKTFYEFGPFSALFGKIPPEFSRRFIRTLLRYAAEGSACNGNTWTRWGWGHISGYSWLEPAFASRPAITEAPEHESAFRFKRNEAIRRQNCFRFKAKKGFFIIYFASQVAKKRPSMIRRRKKSFIFTKKKSCGKRVHSSTVWWWS